MKAKFTTVPLRCAACGQQTHKTLETVLQDGGLKCDCGVFTAIDPGEFEKEVRKSEASMKEFGKRG
jgi:hypothetical protein